MRAGALAIGILVCAGLTQQANATTITQTVTNSASISVAQLTYDPVQIAPNSFYDATFLPFVGAGLYSAIYIANYTFSGTANTAPGHTDFDIVINGDFYLGDYDLETTGGTVTYSTDAASVVPFNLSVGDTIDILGTDPDLISYVMGKRRCGRPQPHLGEAMWVGRPAPGRKGNSQYETSGRPCSAIA